MRSGFEGSKNFCYPNRDKSLLAKERPLLRKLLVRSVVYSKGSLRLEDCAFVSMPKGFV
jgi:hypothetical protein